MKKKLFRPVKASERTGYCLCGCGEKTRIATITKSDRGDVKGFPIRYLDGHNAKDPRWKKDLVIRMKKANWKNGRTIHNGYVLRHKDSFSKKQYNFLMPMFAKHNRGIYIHEHRALVALKEKRILSSNEFVRHLDGNRSNNNISNLLVGSCKDNFLDHDSARKEVMRLRNENNYLKKLLTKANIVWWEGTVKELEKAIK